jgi:hypothetical protein
LAYTGPFWSRPEGDIGIAGAMLENRNAVALRPETLVSELLAAPASLKAGYNTLV